MKKKYDETELKELENKYLGKRICLLDRFGDPIVGECKFIGYNSHFPQFDLQVTINRLPIRHVNSDDIKIIDSNFKLNEK